MTHPRANQLLGYPPEARLLILNADDFGMYPDINEAIFRSIKEGVVCSTSLMTPCKGATHAIEILKAHPELVFGVHLTVICDLETYKYGPLTPIERVPSLVDDNGHFYHKDRIPEFLERVNLDELELEFRAQIETVLAAGLKPAQLDWHCMADGGRAEILELTCRLAKEYGLAVRIGQPPYIRQFQAQGLPTPDHDVMDSFTVETANKSARYAQMLRELPAGLTEWAVHPGLGTPEAQSFDDGWPVRQADFDFLMSPEARDIIQQEDIVLLSYKPLQAIWKQ